MDVKKVVGLVLVPVMILLLIIAGIIMWNSSGDSELALQIVQGVGPIEVPKAPHWDESRQSVYFVDVFKSTVHRYEPKTKIYKWAKVGTSELAFIIPIENTSDKFIISYGPYLALLTWDGNSTTASHRLIGPIDRDVYRANEGKVAPSGSLFVGTHSPLINDNELDRNKAGLYVFNKDLRKNKKLLDNVTVSNGMAWNKAANKFFYIDSMANTVESFSYDKATDELSNRKVVCNFKDSGIPGVPDGMAVDTEDKLWVTSWEGHCVLRLCPESNKILERIELDAYKVTSAVFVGPKLSDLYFTTSNYKMSEDELKKYPKSGYFYEMPNSKYSGYVGRKFMIDESYLH